MSMGLHSQFGMESRQASSLLGMSSERSHHPHASSSQLRLGSERSEADGETFPSPTGGNVCQSLRAPPRQACRVPAFGGLSSCICLWAEGGGSRGTRGRKGTPRGPEPGYLCAGRAARAQSNGCFQAEIVPVTTTVHDDKGNERRITVAQDEGIRPSTSMEALAKLKPAFKKNGSSTAGETGLGEARGRGCVHFVRSLGVWSHQAR